MLKNILPQKLVHALKFVQNEINEIRIRVNMPVVITVLGQKYFLSSGGVSQNRNDAIVAVFDDVDEIILKASKYSVYAINDQVKSGFITVDNGIRLGLCGEAVYENNQIKTVKNITSINIRVANQIFGFADFAFKYIYYEKILSTLILSPPSCGKTTLLREIARKVSTLNNLLNVIIVDERAEIAAVSFNKPSFEVGFCDVLTNCLKSDGVKMATRTLNPNVIICDEIDKSEFLDIKYALSCGVSVIASMHAKDLEDLKNKNFSFQNLFDRYIFLSNRNSIGTYESVYDGNFNVLYQNNLKL